MVAPPESLGPERSVEGSPFRSLSSDVGAQNRWEGINKMGPKSRFGARNGEKISWYLEDHPT